MRWIDDADPLNGLADRVRGLVALACLVAVSAGLAARAAPATAADVGCEPRGAWATRFAWRGLSGADRGPLAQPPAAGRLGFSVAASRVADALPRCLQWEADGFSHVRIDVMWNDVERVRGVYDWASTDASIATLSRAGLTVLPILDTSAPAYQSIPGEPFSRPTSEAAYATLA